ncbi:MAG: pseudouridine synthase [Prevotella sp.]
MNNPFYYRPHPLCREAMAEVAAWIADSGDFRKEADKGKMFGVLIVKDEKGQMGYLAAYSGQIGGRADWNGFVPLIFDYLQPDGTFKRGEAEIEALGQSIEAEQLHIEAQLQQLQTKEKSQVASLQADIDRFRKMMEESKRRRDEQRLSGIGNETERIAESQFQKAELRRKRKKLQQTTAEIANAKEQLTVHLKDMTEQRKRKSDKLQRWLFSHFFVNNALGERRSLMQVYGMIPPSGSGECCEPKLIQYAYSHGLRPLCMAMMWWGESPIGEVRHHRAYYPACNSKCKPLLGFMLQGLEVERNQLLAPVSQLLPILYEDDDVCVVCKPAGMLTVPGKSHRESVYSRMRQLLPHTDSPIIVHRLDMQTSGILVTAKTVKAYHDLQRQFAHHEIEKTYIALLEPAPKGIVTPKEGRISLPLRPDLDDRPRQLVDHLYGREAITDYRMLSDNRIELHPLTGRTHQLRVHCAHSEGLSRPIIGDNLYGHPGERLCLHAARLTFRHPVSGKTMTFYDKPPF